MSFVTEWYESIWGKQGQIDSATRAMPTFTAIESLESYWAAIPAEVQKDPALNALYQRRKYELKDVHAGSLNPLTPYVQGMLDDWQKKIAKYNLNDPKDADKKLAGLAADVLAISSGAAVMELLLGAMPNDEGTVASMKVSQIMAWLGFGAVINAVAHDPVKIGLLRPYSDLLEAKFRNRRPDSADLFKTYQQRSLSTTKITDVAKITDELMKQIETENDAYYDTEISKWGYSVFFSNALKDAATTTLNFSQLSALARQGLYNRGLGTFSLWGVGLDQRVMSPALDALDQQNKIANYNGFRPQMEGAYVEGVIPESDLVEYWNNINVPADVQASMLPRFKKKRDAYAKKEREAGQIKEQDLTVSQIQSAYQNTLISRSDAQNMILSLGYDQASTKILLDLAELRRKLPAAATLKRLPLSDYEKAYYNKLITKTDVLARMQGEYLQFDIDLEGKLLDKGKA